jgi:predicted Zn-dependent protease with MMP-like domain/Flp pilus assembly protein TadD
VSTAGAGIDKGWRQLEAGNHAAARRTAESELLADPESPDALLLLGACCRQQGEAEEALAALRRAAEVDPAWSEPHYQMADILAQDLERPLEALALASRALDLAEESDEFLDAIVLKAGIEVQIGKTRAAQATLAELPPAHELTVPVDLSLDLAYLFLEAELVAEAEHRFSLLTEREAQNPEAWYGLGLCAEERGDEAAKRSAWLRVLALDDKAPLENPYLSESEMAAVAEQALHELPAAARRLIENVPILIVDLPAHDEVEQGLDPRLLGLFAGSAYADACSMGVPPQVTQILLFRKNLERMAIDPEDLREQIRITLLHETGHFFGMSEDDLAGVGLD